MSVPTEITRTEWKERCKPEMWIALIADDDSRVINVVCLSPFGLELRNFLPKSFNVIWRLRVRPERSERFVRLLGKRFSFRNNAITCPLCVVTPVVSESSHSCAACFVCYPHALKAETGFVRHLLASCSLPSPLTWISGICVFGLRKLKTK